MANRMRGAIEARGTVCLDEVKGVQMEPLESTISIAPISTLGSFIGTSDGNVDVDNVEAQEAHRRAAISYLAV